MQCCPKCNRTYPDAAPGFCPQDGTHLTTVVESNINCQKCGYSIPNDAPFCANCGSPKQATISQQTFQPSPAQPQMNQQGYGSQPTYAQNPYAQNPQLPYAGSGQFPQPAAKRKIAVWRIIAAIVFILLGLITMLRGFHVLR